MNSREHEDELIYIDSGAVELCAETGPEHSRVIASLEAGDFIGELNLFTGQRIYVIAATTEPTVVHRIMPENFSLLMAYDVELSDVILAALYQRRNNLAAQLADTVRIIDHPDTPGLLWLLRYVVQRQVPYTWIDPGSAEGIGLCRSAELAENDFPAVILPDNVLRRATTTSLAKELSLVPDAAHLGVLDLAVVGAGPAGLAAAVYGGSEGLQTVVLDANAPGGQAATTSRIENYPGFPRGISGADLTRLCALQALKFGTRLIAPCSVTAIRRNRDRHLTLDLDDGTQITSRAVIVATGARYKSLPLPRWAEFEGRGIYYAATELEARRCSTKPVAVIGGANSAGQAALFLAQRSRHVTLAVRADDPAATMSAYLLERIAHHPNITVATNVEVTALSGTTTLETIALTNNRNSHTTTEVACEALFCFIGAVPATDWLGEIATDANGFICTDAQLMAEPGARWPEHSRPPLPFETSIPCVFAVGDVRAGALRRIAAAIGEGAAAVSSVHSALGWDHVPR